MASQKERYPYLFFDLDGTLTDSAPGILNGVRYALQKMGRAVEPASAYYRYIGPPLLWSFREYAAMSEAEAKQAQLLYREYYDKQEGWRENRMYDGVPEMLQALKAAGYRLAIATGKPRIPTEPILAHFGLAPYFECVSAANDKDLLTKAAVISCAMKMLSASPHEVLMIGDRHHDIEGAAACGVDAMAVLYGYGSQQELSKARFFAKTPAEIVKILEG